MICLFSLGVEGSLDSLLDGSMRVSVQHRGFHVDPILPQGQPFHAQVSLCYSALHAFASEG